MPSGRGQLRGEGLVQSRGSRDTWKNQVSAPGTWEGTGSFPKQVTSPTSPTVPPPPPPGMWIGWESGKLWPTAPAARVRLREAGGSHAQQQGGGGGRVPDSEVGREQEAAVWCHLHSLHACPTQLVSVGQPAQGCSSAPPLCLGARSPSPGGPRDKQRGRRGTPCCGLGPVQPHAGARQ